jgi:hypothetical protein
MKKIGNLCDQSEITPRTDPNYKTAFRNQRSVSPATIKRPTASQYPTTNVYNANSLAANAYRYH